MMIGAKCIPLLLDEPEHVRMVRWRSRDHARPSRAPGTMSSSGRWCGPMSSTRDIQGAQGEEERSQRGLRAALRARLLRVMAWLYRDRPAAPCSTMPPRVAARAPKGIHEVQESLTVQEVVKALGRISPSA